MKNIKLDYNIDILHNEDKINLLLKNVKLKKPITNYHYFIKCKFDEMNLKKEYINKHKKISKKTFISNIKKLTRIWKAMNDEEKNKYKIQNKIEKLIYQKHLMIVNTYIFKGLHTMKFKKPTPYRLFLNIELINGFNNLKENKDIKTEAREKWKLINKEHKDNFKKNKKN